MGDSFQYFDIIIFGMVAAFLVLRLRSVLGRRTGNERPRDLLGVAKRDAQRPDNVVSLPERGRAAEAAASGTPKTVAAGLAQIRGVDPQFDVGAFLEGARGAFDIVVHGFARGDSGTLRPLLSDDVFDRFSEAIRHRQELRETHETNLVTIKSADIIEAELNGRTAFVTVKLVSDQINVTRGPDGAVVDGDADHAVERTDHWTFARNTSSQDPNWLLVATHSA